MLAALKIRNNKRFEEVTELLQGKVRQEVIDEIYITPFFKNAFSERFGTILLNKKKAEAKSKKCGEHTTVCHEIGHFLDNRLGNLSQKKAFASALRSDVEAFVEQYDVENTVKLLNKNNASHGLQDILMGCIDGINTRFHHSAEYYAENGVEAEAFAHIAELYIREDEAKFDLMYKALPRTTKYVIKAIGTLA